MNKQHDPSVGRMRGKTILNTRPLPQALSLAQSIENEGGHCIILPSLDIAPVLVDKKILQQSEASDIWLFLSQYAVQYCKVDVALVKSKTIIAIGKSTAMALAKMDERASTRLAPTKNLSPILIPPEFSSEGLLNIPELHNIQGKTITIFRGKSGRTLLDEKLQERGAIVHEVILYQRILSTWTKEEYALIKQNSIDLALGMSVDSLTYFFSQLELPEKKRLLNVPWLVMSHRVANQAKKLGIKTIYTVRNGDILESLIRCCGSDTMGGGL